MNSFNKKNIYLIRKSPYGRVKSPLGRQIIKEYDKEKDMPYETGKYLEALFQNNDDYLMGIHKTGYSDWALRVGQHLTRPFRDQPDVADRDLPWKVKTIPYRNHENGQHRT